MEQIGGLVISLLKYDNDGGRLSSSRIAFTYITK